MFDGFTQALGETQGRIEPVNFDPVDSFSFVLGSDVPGLFGTFNNGDSLTLSQVGDFDTTTILRVGKSRIRGPSSMPVGASWRCALSIDGVERVRRIAEPGRLRDFNDLGANLAGLVPGNHTLTFTITLVAASAVEVELPAWYLDDVQLLTP